MSENQEKLNEQLFNVITNSKDSDEGKLKKVKYLVRLGADVNAKMYGRSVLSMVKEKELGDDWLEFLINKGANEWVIPKEEGLEVSQGFWNDKGDLKSIEEIKELLKKGADVNASNKYGDTALMVAAYNGHLEVVKYLAQNGADVNAKVSYGGTALMKAVIGEHLDVVKYLAECGADLDVKDGAGRTALMMVANWGKLDVVKCLVECGADLEAKDKDGKTALYWAAIFGKLDVVKCLVEHGADLEAKNKDGRTALDIARECEKADCVKFLEKLQPKEVAKKPYEVKVEVLSGEKKNATVKKRGIWQRMFGGRD